MTDTTQNKPTCCVMCRESLQDNFCNLPNCKCHVQQANLQEASSHTQTTPSEEWGSMFDELWNLFGEVVDGGALIHPWSMRDTIKGFVERTSTAAYEKGKESVNEIYLTRQEAYEKGVRDSLEVVEKQEKLHEDNCMTGGDHADSAIAIIKGAISTLLT